MLGDPKIPFFVHMHKAGGTSVCSIARQLLNGTGTAPSKHWNCNSLELIPVFPSRALANDSFCPSCCARAAAIARERHLGLAVWESPVGMKWLPPTALKCSEFFSYGILMRSPLARIASWMHELLRARKLEFLPAAMASACASGSVAAFLSTLSPSAVAMLDNGLIRTLLGLSTQRDVRPTAYYLGAGEVADSHRRRAAEMLTRFDIVIDLASLSPASFGKWGWQLADTATVWRRPTISGQQSSSGSARTGAQGAHVAIIRSDGMPAGMAPHPGAHSVANASIRHSLDPLYPLDLWPPLITCLSALNAPDILLHERFSSPPPAR